MNRHSWVLSVVQRRPSQKVGDLGCARVFAKKKAPLALNEDAEVFTRGYTSPVGSGPIPTYFRRKTCRP